MKGNLLVITTIFPNPTNMSIGTYNKHIVSELSEHFNIDVIAPIPWANSLKRGIKSGWLLNKARVHHPIFFYPNGVLRNWHNLFYYASIAKLIAKLNTNTKYDAIFGMWLFPDCHVVMNVAAKLNIPYFVKVLGSDVNRLSTGHELYNQSMAIIKHSNKVFCVSEGLKSKIISLGGDPDRLHVINNGIDKRIFFPCSVSEAREKLELSSTLKGILFVGNLKREKGLGELLNAFEKLILNHGSLDTQLFIIGEGPYENEFRQLAGKKEILGSIRFLGRRTPQEVALWMNAANLLCLPSYSEGMPNVVLEALSCNTPVVATAINGIIELAEQDHRVTLVPVKEVDGLEKALINVLENGKKSSGELIIKSWSEFSCTVSEIIKKSIIKKAK